jgi:thioredoxin-related protein
MNPDQAMNRDTMTTRRQFLVGGAAAFMLGGGARAEAPILSEDGLYKQPWFVEGLLELGDDLEAAAKAGRRLAVLWELRGCPYCKEMHLVNFARPDIADYVRARFDIVQLNIRGARMVTDFDDARLTERDFAAKYQVRFTPTIQFFPDSLDGLARRQPDKREVFRMPGYLKPDDFLAVFRYVAERGYERGGLRDFLKTGG